MPPEKKQFAQAFIKLDAWFESTRGLSAYGVIPKPQYVPNPKAKGKRLVDGIGVCFLAPRRGAI